MDRFSIRVFCRRLFITAGSLESITGETGWNLLLLRVTLLVLRCALYVSSWPSSSLSSSTRSKCGCNDQFQKRQLLFFLPKDRPSWPHRNWEKREERKVRKIIIDARSQTTQSGRRHSTSVRLPWKRRQNEASPFCEKTRGKVLVAKRVSS